MTSQRIFHTILMLMTALSTTAQLSFGAETQRSTPDGERPKVFYGINEDPIWNFKDHELSTFAAMLEQTGAGAVRIPLRWRVMEAQKGQWELPVEDRVVKIIPKDVETV